MPERVVDVVLRTNVGQFNKDMAAAGASIRSLEAPVATTSRNVSTHLTTMEKDAHGFGAELQRVGNSLGAWGIPFSSALVSTGQTLSKTSAQGVTAFDKMAAAGKIMSAVVVAAAVAVGVEAVRAFDSQEQSAARLNVAMKNVGLSYSASQPAIQRFDSSMEHLGFTHAQTEDAMSRNIVATHNLATTQKDVSVAADIAAARGMDLASATQLVTRASNGTYTALLRLGLVTKDQVKTFHDGTDAVNYLGQAFAGQAQAKAQTFGGTLRVLSAEGQDLAAKAGPVVIGFLHTLADVLGPPLRLLTQNSVALGIFIGLVGSLATVLITAYAIEKVERAFTVLHGTITGITTLLGIHTAETEADTAATAGNAGANAELTAALAAQNAELTTNVALRGAQGAEQLALPGLGAAAGGEEAGGLGAAAGMPVLGATLLTVGVIAGSVALGFAVLNDKTTQFSHAQDVASASSRQLTQQISDYRNEGARVLTSMRESEGGYSATAAAMDTQRERAQALVEIHKSFQSVISQSPGLGQKFIDSANAAGISTRGWGEELAKATEKARAHAEAARAAADAVTNTKAQMQYAADAASQYTDALNGNLGAMQRITGAQGSVADAYVKTDDAVANVKKTQMEYLAQPTIENAHKLYAAKAALTKAWLDEAQAIYNVTFATSGAAAATDAERQSLHQTQDEIGKGVDPALDSLIAKMDEAAQKTNNLQYVAAQGVHLKVSVDSSELQHALDVLAYMGVAPGSLAGREYLATHGLTQGYAGTVRKQSGGIVPDSSYVLFGERGTGGEAFIPRRGASDPMGVLSTAAGWYGASVVPMQAGGATGTADPWATTLAAQKQTQPQITRTNYDTWKRVADDTRMHLEAMRARTSDQFAQTTGLVSSTMATIGTTMETGAAAAADHFVGQLQARDSAVASSLTQYGDLVKGIGRGFLQQIGAPVTFAAGGEYHQAQVGGPQTRVWSEPETGGEAYIPLGAGKRSRSTKLLAGVADMFGYGIVPMAEGGFVWPVQNFVVSQAYGHNGHPGIDLAVPVGTAVGATAPGTVMVAGSPDPGGYGNQIDLGHAGGVLSRYGHLSQFVAHVGMQVMQGQEIARSGGAAGAPGSGNSTGPHLHFEIRIGGHTVDPASVISGSIPITGVTPPAIPPPNLGPGIPAAMGTAIANVMRFAMASKMQAAADSVSSSPGPAGAVPGGLDGWIRAAEAEAGVPDAHWHAGLLGIAMRESSGNPNVTNTWDINAQRGDPSVGLMQLTRSNFATYGPPGGNPFNPVDNIYAAIRYIQARYGDISRTNTGPHGAYEEGAIIADDGAVLREGLNLVANRTGADEVLLRRETMRAAQGAGAGQVVVVAPIVIQGNAYDGVESRVQAVVDSNMTTLARTLRTLG